MISLQARRRMTGSERRDAAAPRTPAPAPAPTSTPAPAPTPGILVRWALGFGLIGLLLQGITELTYLDPDVFHEMALFREALTLGRVPDRDLFAYTPTVRPTVHHEWGMGAVLYLTTVASGCGGAGLMALKYLLTTVIAAGTYLLARRQGAGQAVFAAGVLLMMPLAWIGFTTVRAQVVTLAFLVALLGMLEADRRGRRWWIAPWLLLYVVWLNMHAGFVVGAGVFALHTLERLGREWARRRSLPGALGAVAHLVAAGLLMGPLVLVNPYGWHYPAYLRRALPMARPLIFEWAPLWRYTLVSGVPIGAYALSLALAAYAVRARGVGKSVGLPQIVVAMYLALSHIRHGSVYALLWLCYVPAWLDAAGLGRALKRVVCDRPRMAIAVGTLCGVLGLSCAVMDRFWELHTAPLEPGMVGYPGGAVEYLAEQHFTGNLFTRYRDGAFVSWNLYPAVKVSMDGRYEVAYPPGAIEENARFYTAAPGWQRILGRYPTDAVLLRRDSPLDQLLARGPSLPGGGPAWKLVYRDAGYSLFVRADRAARLPVRDRPGVLPPAPFPYTSPRDPARGPRGRLAHRRVPPPPALRTRSPKISAGNPIPAHSREAAALVGRFPRRETS